jgi:hypothetical protein
MFGALGASLVDTDAIAHALTAPHGAAMPAMLAEFGDGFADADGALDRAKMRELVFADPGAAPGWKPSCTRASARRPLRPRPRSPPAPTSSSWCRS